jgi:hypothetical protein
VKAGNSKRCGGVGEGRIYKRFSFTRYMDGYVISIEL